MKMMELIVLGLILGTQIAILLALREIRRETRQAQKNANETNNRLSGIATRMSEKDWLKSIWWMLLAILIALWAIAINLFTTIRIME
jgi:Mg2+/citrate symporter